MCACVSVRTKRRWREDDHIVHVAEAAVVGKALQHRFDSALILCTRHQQAHGQSAPLQQPVSHRTNLPLRTRSRLRPKSATPKPIPSRRKEEKDELTNEDNCNKAKKKTKKKHTRKETERERKRETNEVHGLDGGKSLDEK